jgi:hypothetical protein
MAEKSILEQALLQVQTLEEAVKQNAKGILASTMKQELNDLLKESEEEDIEMSEETDMEIPEEETEDMSEQPELDSEDDENDEDLDNEDSMDDEFSADDSMDDEDSVDDLDSMDDEDSFGDDLDSMDDEDSFGDDLDSMGDDVMDMTNASDDEVLRVFKSMKPEDGIVVKKDGDNVEMDVDGDEYIIKLDDGDDFESSDMDDIDSDDEVFEGDMSDDEVFEGDMSDDETIYEIELDEEDELEESDEETHEGKKIEATEAARTKSNPHGDKGPGQGRTGLKSKKMYKAGSGSLNEEIQTLKKQNSEYKKALVLFKEKLNEVAVFNANLAYATRLFTEHTTTKQEKLNILKRFDSVSTMNESKNLFSTIKGELENKKPITESVVNKITNTPTSSSSQEILSEAKAYENPQFKRMKELMGKIK